MRRILLLLALFAAIIGCHKELPPQPVARFTVANAGCEAPCKVIFTSNSENASGLEWDFNDRSEIQRGATVEHEFLAGKDYHVKLIAKSSDGGSHGVTQMVNIKAEPAKPPVADFDMNPKDGGLAPLTVVFDNQSSNAARYKWQFGDKYATTANPDTSLTQNPSHTYTLPGTYTVTLTAYNAEGKSDVKPVTFEVKAEGPTAGFAVTGDDCEAPCEVTFTNSSTKATTYSWDFGDGNASSQTSPKHTFKEPGTYNVILTATGDGGKDTASKSVVIKVAAKNAISINGSYNYPTHIISDAGGNIYICGAMAGTADFGNGKVLSTGFSDANTDFFIAKFNPAGECLWAYTDGSNSDDQANWITLDNANNVYVTGVVNDSPRKSRGYKGGFVMKLSGNGDVKWYEPFGGTGQLAEGQSLGFFETSLGPRIYMAGNIRGEHVLLGSNLYTTDSNDICFVFLNAETGAFGDPTIFGGPNSQYVNAMVLDNAGSAYLTGSFYQVMSFTGSLGRLGSFGGTDAFAAKWSLKDGDWEWAHPMGASESDFGLDLAVDRANNVYTTGSFKGSMSPWGVGTAGDEGIYIGKYTPDGKSAVWGRSGSNDGLDDYSGGIAIGRDGNVLVAGSFSDTGQMPFGATSFKSQGGTDVIISELHHTENRGSQTGRFQVSGGGKGDDRSVRICVTPDGTVYNTGWFTGKAAFNGTELTNGGSSRNTYIVKYKY